MARSVYNKIAYITIDSFSYDFSACKMEERKSGRLHRIALRFASTCVANAIFVTTIQCDSVATKHTHTHTRHRLSQYKAVLTTCNQRHDFDCFIQHLAVSILQNRSRNEVNAF